MGMDDLDKIVDEILGEPKPAPEPASAGRAYPPRVCERCGEEYIPTGSRQRLCNGCKNHVKPKSKEMVLRAEETGELIDGSIYAAPEPDPLMDVTAAYKYLRDIAEHWNVNMPDLLDCVGRMDTIAQVMDNAGEK